MYFLGFFILSNFYFYLMNALIYVIKDKSIHKIKMKVGCNEKQKKTWVFCLY